MGISNPLRYSVEFSLVWLALVWFLWFWFGLVGPGFFWFAFALVWLILF